MEHSEEEVGIHKKYFQDLDYDDETSEALIRSISHQNYQSLEDEFQHITQNQGLSPRVPQHDKFNLRLKMLKLSLLADKIQDYFLLEHLHY